MDERDVTPDQAAKLAAWLVPALLKLGKLHERLKARGFPAGDPLLVRAAAAHEAVRLLRLEVHELEKMEGRTTAASKPAHRAPDVPQWVRAMRPDGKSG